MGGLRWTQRWMAAAATLVLTAGVPAGAAQVGVLSTTVIGASGSTLYMSVTNVSLEPVAATVNVAVTSGSTTLVGSTNVSLAPLATAAVPVPMSGPISTSSKLTLSSSLEVSVIDNQDPFCN
jgi:hypothetical protein